ncbi:MAG: ABC transporter permease [Lachnospiraceae bacterium]|nr:ABC transporter permease [Lachnospiraceae bacterium]
MRGLSGFTKRNILVFFKDIHSVIFSMLTPIILLMLYMFFLKSNFVSAINAELDGLDSIIKEGDVSKLVNCLLLSGIMGSALITVPYNCLMTLIADRERKVDCDVLATPLKRWQIIAGYFLSATVSSFVMTGGTAAVGILALGGPVAINLSANDMLLLYGTIFLGAVSATVFFMIVVLLFKTQASCGAFFGILSAAAGFVIGAYMPLSQFSAGLRNVCNLFPASNITVMLRNALMGGMLTRIDKDINGIDNGNFVKGIKSVFDFNTKLFDKELSLAGSGIYILCFSAIMALIVAFVYSKTYKKR